MGCGLLEFAPAEIDATALGLSQVLYPAVI
jgi:hypothetical protein